MTAISFGRLIAVPCSDLRLVKSLNIVPQKLAKHGIVNLTSFQAPGMGRSVQGKPNPVYCNTRKLQWWAMFSSVH